MYSEDFDVERMKPLLNAVISRESDEHLWDRVYDAVTESTPPHLPPIVQQTSWLRNTSSFANSSEYRKYADDVKEELGPIYVGVPGFFEAYFGGIEGLESEAKAMLEICKKGDEPIYHKDNGWKGWPDGAKERNILGWFVNLISHLIELADEHHLLLKTLRRPLAQPDQPLSLWFIGFVDDPSTRHDSKCYWSQILVPGELKSNPSADTALKTWLDIGRYAREVFASQETRRFVLGFTLCGSRMRLWQFDRLGGIASAPFDIYKDGLQFLSVVLGFL
jgi:hypothetical protein